jgi:hypothetical protein
MVFRMLIIFVLTFYSETVILKSGLVLFFVAFYIILVVKFNPYISPLYYKIDVVLNFTYFFSVLLSLIIF